MSFPAALFSTLLLLFSATLHARAETVTIASASNFATTLNAISERFEALTGHDTRISYASTGKLYAQILHGAPFEVFLSADRERPALLARRGMAESPFTYATGKLVLWTKSEREPGARALASLDDERIALANPKTAPYGKAALSVIRNLGLEEKLADNLVYGDNIAQTFQFAATGNAAFGFVARAQTHDRKQGSSWEIPQALYAPIRQDAVLLTRGSSNPAALAFIDFLKSDEARRIIRESGYETD
jgi:molybdate transport system substrate-binding protein